MTEKDFEKKVKKFLSDQGCWVLKTWSNGIQREGVPDLLVCCNGYFIGIELKAANGHPSELQKWNIKQIRNSGGIAIVLYPDQFDDFKTMIEYINFCDGSDDFNWFWEQQKNLFDRSENK